MMPRYKVKVDDLSPWRHIGMNMNDPWMEMAFTFVLMCCMFMLCF